MMNPASFKRIKRDYYAAVVALACSLVLLVALPFIGGGHNWYFMLIPIVCFLPSFFRSRKLIKQLRQVRPYGY